MKHFVSPLESGSHGTAPTSNTIPSSPEIGGSRWPQDISLDFSSFSIFSASPQILFFSGAAFSEQYFSRVPLSSLRFLCGSSRHCPFHLLLPSSYSCCSLAFPPPVPLPLFHRPAHSFLVAIFHGFHQSSLSSFSSLAGAYV